MKSQAQGRSRLARWAAAGGCILLLGASAACAAKVDETQEQQQEVVAKEVAQPAKHRHWRGPVNVVIDAARAHGELTLEQEQTLDSIAEELEADREGRRALHERVKSSAVSVVRSGTTNSEAFERSVREVVTAVEEHVQKNSDALEEIHAILTPEQRASVADALRAHIDQKFGPRPERQKRQRRGFQRFASHLMLSRLQLEQLEAVKKELMGEKRELRPSHDELHALVDAFEGEEFGAALAELHAKKAKILRARVARAGKRTDTVLSIFTPEQRDLIADLILEGPHKVLFGEQGAASAAE